VIKSEPNARIHLLIAVVVLVLGELLNVTNAELAALFFAIIIVFVAEVVNTALEKTLDLLHPDENNEVRKVKDMAAGAVLVAAVGAAGIGVAIFYPYFLELLWRR
jgi:diacylglycerol kinase